MDQRSNRIGPIVFFGVIAVIGLVFALSLLTAWLGRDDWRPGQVTAPPVASKETHAVVIRDTNSAPRVQTGQTHANGQPVSIDCATCHDSRPPNVAQNNGAALVAFHQGLKYQHGEQTCLSCHHPENYNALRRADGQQLEFSESMQLCAQCHSQQYKSYQEGTHGGMQGYWDLTRGGRTRNSCIHCHDPHHPAYPTVMPVFPPKLVPGESPHPPSDH